MGHLDIAELKQIVEIAMDQEVASFAVDADLYADLGMDSMGAVALVVEVQRRFRVRIRDEDMPSLRTPAALLSYVNGRLALALPVNQPDQQIPATSEDTLHDEHGLLRRDEPS